MGSLTFDGVTSTELGLIIDGYFSRGVAQRKLSKVPIPGGNGDRIMSQEAFENVQESYIAYWLDQGQPEYNDLKFQAIVDWMKDDGYYRLTNSDYPSHFWMAKAIAPTEDQIVNYRDCFHSVPLIFDRKPQCFLDSGDEAQAFDQSSGGPSETGWSFDIYNPTKQKSKPHILVNLVTAGSQIASSVLISVSGKTFQVTPPSGITEFEIDCEREQCYVDRAGIITNLSMYTAGPYIELPPGWVSVGIGTGIQTITITPRWWER